MTMTAAVFSEASVLDYVRSQADLRQHFTDPDDLVAEEVGDGNLNLVFIVRNRRAPDEGVVVKQAPPYLRVIGESWPLTRERIRFEAQALLLYNELTPKLAPEVYQYDEERALVAMEYLGHHQVMRKPLV